MIFKCTVLSVLALIYFQSFTFSVTCKIIVEDSDADLSRKIKKLQDFSQKSSVIKFNNNKFNEYVKNTPRNYSVVVMFTALGSSRGCQICPMAYKEYNVLADSYMSSLRPNLPNKLFFAMVDFDEGSGVFQSLGIQSAPNFFIFHPKISSGSSSSSKLKYDTMDISRSGFDAQNLAKMVFEFTDVKINISRPSQYVGSLVIGALTIMLLCLMYVRRSNLQFLQNKTAWSVLCCGFVLFMISGQMWNHIRGAPFMKGGPKGGISYIHGSSQGQYVVETYFVFFMYGAVASGILLLIHAMPDLDDDSHVQSNRKSNFKSSSNHPMNVINRLTSSKSGKSASSATSALVASIGLGILIFFFSLILSVFRSKTGGYPYSLLFK